MAMCTNNLIFHGAIAVLYFNLRSTGLDLIFYSAKSGLTLICGAHPWLAPLGTWCVHGTTTKCVPIVNRHPTAIRIIREIELCYKLKCQQITAVFPWQYVFKRSLTRDYERTFGVSDRSNSTRRITKINMISLFPIICFFC